MDSKLLSGKWPATVEKYPLSVHPSQRDNSIQVYNLDPDPQVSLTTLSTAFHSILPCPFLGPSISCGFRPRQCENSQISARKLRAQNSCALANPFSFLPSACASWPPSSRPLPGVRATPWWFASKCSSSRRPIRTQ